MVAAAIWGNSLSMLAEVLRVIPVLAIEFILLGLLIRINRGELTAYDNGTRKVERLANLVAGGLQVYAAVWLLSKLAGRYGVPQEQPALGLAFATLIAIANLTINVVVFQQMWRAAQGGQSLIMNGQIIVRLSKLVASVFVAVAIAVNAVFGPEGIGGWADLIGTSIVIVVMLVFGGQMVRDSMPHLIDRALGERQQQLINRALVDHFDDFDELINVRTRTEGNQAWIEIELGFAPARKIEDVTSAADRVTARVCGLIPGAKVFVLIRKVRNVSTPPTLAVEIHQG
jgi:ferrous-iron efflux pump FieF